MSEEDQESEETEQVENEDQTEEDEDFEWAACREDNCDSMKAEVNQLTDSLTRYTCKECGAKREVQTPGSMSI